MKYKEEEMRNIVRVRENSGRKEDQRSRPGMSTTEKQHTHTHTQI